MWYGAALLLCLGYCNTSFVCGPGAERGMLQPFTRDKDEEHTERGVDQNGDGENHDRPLSKELTNVGLTNSREVERCVLAEADESEDRIQRVLV